MSNESSDKFPAQPRPSQYGSGANVNINQLLSDLLSVSHTTAAAIGVMQGEQRATRQLIEAMQKERTRDDDGLKDKHRDVEARLREIEKHMVSDVELDAQASEADVARKELKTELMGHLESSRLNHIDMRKDIDGLSRWKFWAVGAAAGAGAAAATAFELIKFGTGH